MINLSPRSINLKVVLALVFLLAFAGGCSKLFGGSKTGTGGDGTLSEAELNAQREGRFGSGSIPTAEEGGPFANVPFDFDSFALSEEGRQAIKSNAELLRSNSNLSVTLEGHCDERGTAEYNMALGDRRARSVKEYLVSLGVPGSRLNTVSYGEEVPVDPAHDEAAWARNRRVHFSAHGEGSR